MGAADWVKDKLALYGLAADEDAWDETIPGLGRVRAAQSHDRHPGLDARRDPRPRAPRRHRAGPGANDNASGTAALIELARGYGTLSTAAAGPKPMHTLIFLSSDGGAFGGYGAERFARRRRSAGVSRPSSRSTGSPGRRQPRLELAGFAAALPDARADPHRRRPHRGPARSAARAARLARAARRSRRAVRLRRAGAVPRPPDLRRSARDRLRRRPRRQCRHDRASCTRALRPDGPCGGLDPLLARRRHRARRRHGRARLPRSRIVRGWAIELLLLVALIPFLTGSIDLFARCRRRGCPLPGVAGAADAARRLALGRRSSSGSARSPACSRAGPRSRRRPTALPSPTGRSPGCSFSACLAALGWSRARRLLAPVAPDAGRSCSPATPSRFSPSAASPSRRRSSAPTASSS